MLLSLLRATGGISSSSAIKHNAICVSVVAFTGVAVVEVGVVGERAERATFILAMLRLALCSTSSTYRQLVFISDMDNVHSVMESSVTIAT